MRKIITIILMFVTLSCIPVQAQEMGTVYVSPSGNDANSGTLTSPLQTLTAAYNSGAGTVILRGGEYVEPYLTIRRSVILKSFAGERAVIRSIPGYFGLQIAYEARDVSVIGLDIDAINATSAGIKITSGAQGVILQDVNVYNSKGHGILISSASGVIIRGGSVHDNGGYIDQFHSNNYHGIYLSGVDDVTIDGVEVYRSGGHGVHIYGVCQGCVTTVRNSYIHDNPAGVGAYYGQVYILDNVLERNGNTIVSLQYNLEGALVQGNVMSFPNPGWTSVYIANVNVPSVITVTGNHIHDSYLGLWLRNNGDPNVFVNIQSNKLDANTPVLIQNTNMTILQDDNE